MKLVIDLEKFEECEFVNPEGVVVNYKKFEVESPSGKKMITLKGVGEILKALSKL